MTVREEIWQESVNLAKANESWLKSQKTNQKVSSMEIVKKGIIPEQKIYDATCRNCGTEIRFSRDEAEYHPVIYYSDPRESSYLSIPCPLCHKNITCIA